MRVGIFGDVHITKNMRTLQSIWEESAKKSIIEMYKLFDEEKVEAVICLGDFFDTPRIEAKHLHFLLPILSYINTRAYPTYMLLGNHEIDDDEHNILEYLSEYHNIKPVVDYDIILQGDLTLIPYNVNPEELDSYYIHNHYVFTHHDIYGSELAGGKTKAFFGLDASIFKEAKRVFNGHVHLKSKIPYNIINAGSLLVSQQGELRVGDYPSYYILDTLSGDVVEYDNKHSMIYLAIQESELDKISGKYDPSKLVLRVDYEGEIPNYTMNTAHTSWRKKIESIESNTTEIVSKSNFDLKNYLVEYIKKDSKVDDKDKEEYIRVGLEVLN